MTRNNSFSRWLAAASGLAIVAVVAGAAWFYRTQEEDLRRQAHTELQVIAHLKADQIAAWRHERLADAYVLMESPFLSEQVARLMASPHPQNTKDMLTRLRSLRKRYNYFDVMLVNAHGQVRLRVGGIHDSLRPHMTQSLAEALRKRQPIFTDIHAGTGRLPPHMGVIAPIFAKSSAPNKPVGAIILLADVQEFLYPLIQSWPTPSRTAEALLVRRDGDSALFLNDLRFRKHAVHALRIPLSRTDVPAVMAVLGRQGVVEGKDYRGVEVLSVLKAVPDSPWFLVAKVDAKEVFAAWRSRSILILALTILLVLAAAAAAGLVWQRNDKLHYQSLVRAQAELRESEETLSTTLRSIGDAVISTDVQGRVVSMNPIAEELTGWTLSEAVARPISEVINIVNALTGEPAPVRVDEVLSTGEVRHFANHTTLISRDGTRRQIADSAAPIRDDSGAITGVVLVFSDVTEQYRVRQALLESEARFDQLAEHSRTVAWEVNAKGLYTYVSHVAEQVLGYRPDELVGRIHFYDLHPEAVRKAFKKAAFAVFARKEPFQNLENAVHAKDGRQVWVSTNGIPLLDADGALQGYRGSDTDMTERKRTEEDLWEKSALLAKVVNSVPDYIFAKDTELRNILCNDAYAAAVGKKPEELVGHTDIENGWDPELVRGNPAKEIRGFENDDRDALSGKTIHNPCDPANTPNGALIYDTHKMPLYGKDAEIIGMLGIARDITESKQAEEEVRSSRAFLDNCINAIADPIFVKDDTRRFVLVNDALCAIVGRTRENLIGEDCNADFPKEEVEVFVKMDAAVLDTGEVNVSEESLTNLSTGEVSTIVTRKSRYVDPTGKRFIVGVIRDITAGKRVEEKLRESEEKYRVIFEGSFYAIMMADSKTKQFIYANPSACRLFGYTESELLKLGVGDIHPKDSLDHVASEFESQARGEKTLASELPCLRKDGTVFYADVTSALTTLKGGRECAVGFFADITERRDLSRQLEVAATQIRGLMTQVVTGNSLAGRFSNPSLSRCWEEKKCTKTDCPAHGNTANLRCWEIAGTFCKGEVHGDFAKKYGDCSLCPVYQSARANPLLELGETFNAMSTILEDRHTELSQAKVELEIVNTQLEQALLVSKDHAAAVEVAKDQIEENAIELRHQATHDALTGLPNRKYFEQHLSELITDSAGNKSRSMAVLFLDLDKFKLINDTLGHKVGDLLLIETGERLQSCLRSEDLLARMGGDEFTVILPRCNRRSISESVASRMIDSISKPFDIQGHKFVIGVSIGLARYPSDAADAVTLLKHADAAMYKAKQAGRGTFRWFTGDVNVDNQQRAEMEMDIRAALEKGQFEVYYQPIVSLGDGEILSAEALLRWEHPEKGMISPSLFIPIAEEIGVIGRIGDYVLRTACTQTMAWRDEGIHLSKIAVNVSTRQVGDASWLDTVSTILSDTGIDARCLNLELTESDFAADYESMRDTLQKVQELGIGLAIDDFGIGQSSLGRLKDFPVIHLKIDGSFVRDIEHNKDDSALVRSIVEMAHGQCIQVTAEWVETESQMEILRTIGCDFAQGYYFSPALSSQAFGDFVRKWMFAQRKAQAA